MNPTSPPAPPASSPSAVHAADSADLAHISGLILSGGRGARMGHVDKGLQPFRSKPMVSHVIERFGPQVAHLAINANQNHATYRSYGVAVVADQIADFAGPLAGLQVGMMQCQTPLLATAPCDSPFLPLDLVRQLHHALTLTKTDLAAAVTGTDADRRRHPVFCLLKVDLLPQLNSFLDGGGRRMVDWFDSLSTVDVHFPDHSAFSNINTLAELAELESHRISDRLLPQ